MYVVGANQVGPIDKKGNLVMDSAPPNTPSDSLEELKFKLALFSGQQPL
jgi:hypothetical protein